MHQPPLPKDQNRLGRRFFAAPTTTVAQKLLGKYLIRKLSNGEWVGGKIVETEAYLHAGDPASHSFRGQTQRNAAMFADPGVLYVYTIHAKHCMNFSTERNGIGAAVLIRALQPIWGIDEMRRNRNQMELRNLASGPAKLCQALSINLEQNLTDTLICDWLAITHGEKLSAHSILATPRIGIRRGTDLLLRFLIAGTSFASRGNSQIGQTVTNLKERSSERCRAIGD
jgi:DNA-3-methyladenine glycosylase